MTAMGLAGIARNAKEGFNWGIKFVLEIATCKSSGIVKNSVMIIFVWYARISSIFKMGNV